MSEAAREGNGATVLRRRKPGQPPIRVGHRGAGAHSPHNSRTSFETAIAMGVDLVETDVRQCASGELVLAHDDYIRGEEGDKLHVAASSLARLRSVDIGAGDHVLLLEDLLTLAHGRVGLMLDLKGEDFECLMVDILRSSGFDPGRVIIPGGSRISRDRLRDLAPEFPLSFSLGAFPAGEDPLQVIADIDTPAVTWHYSMLTEPTIGRLHDHGKTVYGWTVDQEGMMDELIARGIDGVITNRPDALNTVLSSAQARTDTTVSAGP